MEDRRARLLSTVSCLFRQDIYKYILMNNDGVQYNMIDCNVYWYIMDTGVGLNKTKGWTDGRTDRLDRWDFSLDMSKTDHPNSC